MVSVSPRMRDSLDYEDPEESDPRLSWGFRSLTLGSSDYDRHDLEDDHRPFSASPDPSASRRRRRQRQSDAELWHVQPHEYRTVADGDLFRLAVLKPGTGSRVIEIELIWESTKSPRRDYKCLSYCWQTKTQDASILVDGYRFDITKTLLGALRSLRKARASVLIWIDQICINQSDDIERAHQVSIMKLIYSRARKVVIWLGEFERSGKLCEYAKKTKRSSDDTSRFALKGLLPTRHLHSSMQQLLDRPWFSRVWVISEVCLASQMAQVSCGSDASMSWENLVSLVRDIPVQPTAGFEKQHDVLGNPRQRIAILTQMIGQQKGGIPHADISQMLILAKGSEATHSHDKIYSFYGMTLLSTIPDYRRPIKDLYVEAAQDYINGIEACYASWKDLEEGTRTFQLMSILYSAGALHQKHPSLPSWVPDWDYPWYQSPLWTRANGHIFNLTSWDAWTEGMRGDYRAGGDHRDTFEILTSSSSQLLLHLLVVLVDTIFLASENTPVSTPTPSGFNQLDSEASKRITVTGKIRYGRTFFKTARGYVGLATPGIEPGDVLAILLGGDVPVILRPVAPKAAQYKPYKLLCECFVLSDAIMSGDLMRAGSMLAEDIVLI